VGLLEEASFSPGFFDFINLGDLIEHVSDPRGLLELCFSLLKSQGQIIITTPNLDSFWAQSTYQLYRWFGVPWSTLTPPHHLFQFSTGNLQSLMEQVGLKTTVLGFNRPSSLKYELGMLHLWKRYKKSGRLSDLFFASFSFAVYGFLYIVNLITFRIRPSDIGVVIIGSKS
jgi:SAM-dependent methyltransferase